MKVGILYICTGRYQVFWPDFYENFSRYFMPECEKEYFVFTDAERIAFEEEPRVHRIFQPAKPWPMSTLTRFDAFLEIEDQLKALDYLFFANANLFCMRTVQPEELLPDAAKGQTLTAVCHLPYYGKPPMFHPYDRNPKSRACIPYNCGEYYVAGGLNGGTAADYLAMCRELKARIDEDLARGVIAKCHDESQLNRLVAEQPQRFRVVGPLYCVPEETPQEGEVIRVQQKAKRIDIAKVKQPPKPQGFIARKWEAFCLNWLPYAWRLRDRILHKTV